MSEVLKALLAAQNEVKSISKDARNDFGKYDYTSAENMLSYCRGLLNKHGLAPIHHSTTWCVTDGVPCVTIECSLLHAESAGVMEGKFSLPAPERKGTPLDKAAAASVTTALSYWLRGVLLLPRGDGIDQFGDSGNPWDAYVEQHIAIIPDLHSQDECREFLKDTNEQCKSRGWAAAQQTIKAAVMARVRELQEAPA